MFYAMRFSSSCSKGENINIKSTSDFFTGPFKVCIFEWTNKNYTFFFSTGDLNLLKCERQDLHYMWRRSVEEAAWVQVRVWGSHLPAILMHPQFSNLGNQNPRTNNNKVKCWRGPGEQRVPFSLLPGEPTISVAVEKVTEWKKHELWLDDLQLSHCQDNVVREGKNPCRRIPSAQSGEGPVHREGNSAEGPGCLAQVAMQYLTPACTCLPTPPSCGI